MKRLTCSLLASVAAAACAAWQPADAASHREAPVTSVDRTADITDWYAFVSPDAPGTVTLILAVDPLLEPGNGPNYFPFDANLRYSLLVDNDRDAVPDVAFEVRFTNEQRLPAVPVALVGAGSGVPAPANSPPPVPPGRQVIPPAVTALDGPGSQGIGLRQRYTVTLVRGGRRTTLASRTGRPIAVPSNVGPRTMPNYGALFESGVFQLDQGVKVFAGTTDDAFYIDLGATFDSLNFRPVPGPGSTGIPAVLSPRQDRAMANFVADEVSGYNVNTIAIQAPIGLLTRAGNRPGAGDADAVIGTYGATSRARIELRERTRPVAGQGPRVQVQRMGNPLFNELIIGTGSKDLWSRSDPKDDGQFAAFALDPLIARVAQAAYGGAFAIPTPPRTDLLPVVTYAPPIAAPGGPAGPVADLLRLNVGVPPTPFGRANRLGLLGGDPAGFPNGRRPFDDVTDITLRIVVGGVLARGFNVAPNNALGDGVNVNDRAVRKRFPYVPPAQDGRNGRHIDPREPGCAGSTCPVL